MLHPLGGSPQEYLEALQDPHRWKPLKCPLCGGQESLTAHGFYERSVVDLTFDGVIRICRYLCLLCRRTVSLLPEFLLPYLRFSIPRVGRFLKARLLEGQTLKDSAVSAGLPDMPYQRGQHWIRRFTKHAGALAAALVVLTKVDPAPSFVCRALSMLQTVGWIAAHRFLFSGLRLHLLGWPPFLAPEGRCAALPGGALQPAT